MSEHEFTAYVVTLPYPFRDEARRMSENATGPNLFRYREYAVWHIDNSIPGHLREVAQIQKVRVTFIEDDEAKA